MSDIFISYAREDFERVKPLAEALERSGWDVFWDYEIPLGSDWYDCIGRELSEARCVVVVWSESSTESTWVREEAGDARERGVLIPVNIDPRKPPLGFRSLQTLSLEGWDGRAAAQEFQDLAKGVQSVIGSASSREAGGVAEAESGRRPNKRQVGRGEGPHRVFTFAPAAFLRRHRLLRGLAGAVGGTLLGFGVLASIFWTTPIYEWLDGYQVLVPCLAAGGYLFVIWLLSWAGEAAEADGVGRALTALPAVFLARHRLLRWTVGVLAGVLFALGVLVFFMKNISIISWLNYQAVLVYMLMGGYLLAVFLLSRTRPVKAPRAG